MVNRKPENSFESCYLQVDESGWLTGMDFTGEESSVLNAKHRYASFFNECVVLKSNSVESTRANHGFFSDLIS
jgi:hypothetical protein